MPLDRFFAVAALALGLISGSAHARLFYQTYGAVVPAGDGCVWNANQDYFVPRHCDSCRYDLWSACKTSRTNSPACKTLHQFYPGYCSPYGTCRYWWRDHVYKSHCCCTPLRAYHGPWRYETCRSSGRGCGSCGGDACGGLARLGGVNDGCEGLMAGGGYLPNVEAAGGTSLGSMPPTSFASSFMGMGGGMGGGMGMNMGMGSMPGMMPGGMMGTGQMPQFPAGGTAPINLPALPPVQPQTLPSYLPSLGS